VIAIEDRRFYSHHGIDLRGILRASWHDLRGEGGLEGASTITQQLARISYLSPERSLRRKVQEIIIALWLETRLSKHQSLARYLNSAYFGAGAYGIDAAAQRYFGKKAGSLNLAESAMLAGLIRSPTQLAPTRNLEAARRRADTVLEAMVAAGYIDKAHAAAARAHLAQLAEPPETEPGQNYFVDTAESELKRLVGSPPMDLGVDTTLDPRLQEAAERVVEKWLEQEGVRPACPPGRARRARAGRRGPRARRRPGLYAEPVQSRGPGTMSGGIAVQDFRLSRRVQCRLHARQRRRRPARHDRGLAAEELRERLSGARDLAYRFRPIDQYGRGAADPGSRCGASDRYGQEPRNPHRAAGGPEPGARLGRGHFARHDCGNGCDRRRQQGNRTVRDPPDPHGNQAAGRGVWRE